MTGDLAVTSSLLPPTARPRSPACGSSARLGALTAIEIAVTGYAMRSETRPGWALAARWKMNYDVLLTREDDKFVARVCQLPAIAVESDTEEDALTKAQATIESYLAGARIVRLEVDKQPETHPWQRYCGMFADDPDWEAFQASIREHREAVDRASDEE